MINMSIDYETADRITRLTLTDSRDYMQSELDQYHATQGTDNPYWLHPEDVMNNQKMIHNINAVLAHFGGELYGERKAG